MAVPATKFAITINYYISKGKPASFEDPNAL